MLASACEEGNPAVKRIEVISPSLSLLYRSTCWRKEKAACCRPLAPGTAPTAAPPERSARHPRPFVCPSSPRPPLLHRLITAGPGDIWSARMTTRTKMMTTEPKSGELNAIWLQLALPVTSRLRGHRGAPGCRFIFFIVFMDFLLALERHVNCWQPGCSQLLILTSSFNRSWFLCNGRLITTRHSLFFKR